MTQEEYWNDISKTIATTSLPSPTRIEKDKKTGKNVVKEIIYVTDVRKVIEILKSKYKIEPL